MPYSDLLMTLIFIKRLCDRGDAGGDLRVPPAPHTPPQGDCMWTDVQRLASRAATTEAANRPNPWVSTLSLCNANFGPRLA